MREISQSKIWMIKIGLSPWRNGNPHVLSCLDFTPPQPLRKTWVFLIPAPTPPQTCVYTWVKFECVDECVDESRMKWKVRMSQFWLRRWFSDLDVNLVNEVSEVMGGTPKSSKSLDQTTVLKPTASYWDKRVTMGVKANSNGDVRRMIWICEQQWNRLRKIKILY